MSVQTSPARPSHSRLAVASFSFALLGLIVPIQLILLLALGVSVSHAYALVSVIVGGACGAAAFLLACAALFDRRKNRVLGLAGWWLSIVALTVVAASIRLAVRHNLLHP